MAPLLPLLVLGGGAAFLLLSKKTPAAPGAGTVVGPTGTPTNPSQIAGMTPDQIKKAVQVALQTETDPAKLQEFADSLLPDYAAYSQQLQARATQLLTPGPANGVIPQTPAVQPASYTPSVGPAPSPILPPAPPLVTPEPVLPPAPPPPPPPTVVPNDPPTPETFPDPGSTAFVITHDTGPSGNLNIRDIPGASGNVLSQVGHGTSVTIIGPPSNGWYPVETPSGVQGYASGSYLGADPPADAPGGADYGQELVSSADYGLASGSSA